MPRLQFSLRDLLVATALIGLALAFVPLVSLLWFLPLLALSCLAVCYACILLGTIRGNKKLLSVAIFTGIAGVIAIVVYVQQIIQLLSAG